MNRTTPRRYTLRLEILDERTNPSGNVTAVISGGQLQIVGDSADNSVGVQQDLYGNVYVYGGNGTSVNGFSSVYLGAGVLSGLDAQMGLGSDAISVVGVRVNGNLNVQTSDGHDYVALQNVFAGKAITVGTGTGNDGVEVAGIRAGFAIDLRGGDHFDVLGFYSGSAPFMNASEFEHFV